MIRFSFLLFLGVLSAGGIMPAMVARAADTAPVTLEGNLPEGDAPLLRLTPDKIELVKLDRDAAHVMVGNPKHVLGVIETPRSVVLVPRAPGASQLEITDAAGQVIYKRAVIVAAPTQHYVRVRKACSADAKGCAPYNVYYCPDMCHQVALPAENVSGSGGGGSSSNGGAAASGGATGAGNAGAETINDGAPQ